jgi:3-deoxy-manno-octulosonate cytidylyltransferase (CMP-KDO synthetase)
MNVIGVIPARYESSRFPGKPLADILGKSMIQRVYEQCVASTLMDVVIVATDDQRIFDKVEEFGGRVKMTRSDHISGTDRIAEVAADFDEADIIINIQGDEPMIDPAQIDQLVSMIKDKAADIGTLGRWIDDDYAINNPNVVKVISDTSGKAKYFSRATIPFNRSDKAIKYRQHIGIYGFRNEILQQLTKLAPSDLEQSESLEQLRWLENGYDIYIEMSDYLNIGVDTPADLEHIVNLLKEQR